MMTLDYRGVICAILLVIFATNFEAGKSSNGCNITRSHPGNGCSKTAPIQVETKINVPSETLTKRPTSNVPTNSSGTIEKTKGDFGSGNKTTDSSQDGRGTEETKRGGDSERRDSMPEKEKETLRKLAKNIDAKNKTQIQIALASFKRILSDRFTKINDDLLAVKLLENVGKTIASQLKQTQTMPASIGKITDDQVFGVVAMHGMSKTGFNFPDMIAGFQNTSSFPARINVPSAVLNSNAGSNVSLVFMLYTASLMMQSRTGNESYNVTGKVTLASMFPKPTIPFREPVVITIQNPKKSSSKASLTSVCVYLMENSSTQNTSRFGAWSNKGCKLAYSNKSHSVCHCYHLTNFAILTRFSSQKIPKEHELAFSIITYIGLSLSIFGCLATLFVHFMLPKLWTDRTFIHMNLVTALAIANIVFLFQKLPVVGSDGCTTLAFILLYFYLAAFSWMMLEGIHIYRMLVKVFESGKDPRKAYFAAGWGIPLLLVVITVAIFRDNVTSEYYCWLSATNGALWMFAGPVCLVICVNMVMLLVVMRTSFHHHSQQAEKRLKRSMAKTVCILLPVLGITWLVGLVTFNKDIIEMQYIFAIVNSLQVKRFSL